MTSFSEGGINRVVCRKQRKQVRHDNDPIPLHNDSPIFDCTCSFRPVTPAPDGKHNKCQQGRRGKNKPRCYDPVADNLAQGYDGPTARQLASATKIATSVHLDVDGTFVPTLLSLNCVTSNDSPDTPTSIAALVAPSRLHDALSKESSFQIIWDSGASGCISHDIDDFVGDIDKPESIRKLTGLAKGLAIAGTGHVEWAIPDEFGNHRVLRLPAYYVPKANV